ncbi:MAG: lactate racemase domain-containing protein, partial [Pseudomonadota bacterium]
MIPQTIPIPLPGGLETPLPQFHRASQRFNAEEIVDVDAHVASEFAKIGADLTGKSVAVAVGSRGIRSQPPVVRALVNQLKAAGAMPFLVPAMGSHGTGTAEGQKKILESLGMSEADMDAPIRSSMDVVKVAEVGDMPVYCDRLASEADHIIAVNRVKPHTSFRGPVESGLCKMLVIGLGKHTGAVEFHRR